MSLITDYRPDTLEDFYGNAPLIKSLGAILKRKRDKIPHVFLLVGSAGCGKTTLGRIIKSELGCHESEYYEMNAASVRGIDTIREIERNCLYPPMAGSCRVWLLDEVHQYPTATQEAMLKMLEEAPDHAYFIMGTTDPQKLKSSLRTRCTTFEVKPLEFDDMEELLLYIMEEEEIDISEKTQDKVISKIYKESGGGPRAALQLLEHIVDLDEEDMVAAINKSALEETQSIDLCRALIARKQWHEIAKILSNMTSEPESLRIGVMRYAESVLLNPKSKKPTQDQAALVIECFSDNFFSSGKQGVTLACYQSVR